MKKYVTLAVLPTFLLFLQLAVPLLAAPPGFPRMNPRAENPPARNSPAFQPRLHYTALGTGRTTGHIATLVVSNPASVPLRTVVGDMFIPSDQDYQGYVVLQTYPVEVPPFSTVHVSLEGYCTNVQRPPVPDGCSLPDVSQWVPWVEADPLPEPGKMLPPAFFIVHEVPPGDPLAITYPGTTVPFPYRIDFNRNPRQAARLLLHAAWAAGQAFDQYVREGKIRPAAGRSPEALRHDMIQQSLWAYAARLEGKIWDKMVFAGQLTEEAEQQLNRPAAAFPEETQHQVDRETQDLWAGISLVGAGAKLIPPSADHPTDVFQETPAGPGVFVSSVLSRIVDNADPDRPDMPDRLVSALIFLQKNDTTPALQAFHRSAREKWKTWLVHFADQINTGSDTALRDIFMALNYLQTEPGGALPDDERRALTGTLIGKLNMHVHARVAALQPDDPAYLGTWRMLKCWQTTRWYADYCAAGNPLKTLVSPQSTHGSTALNPTGLALSGASWKHTFLPAPGVAPKKFPWWIPAVAAGGGVVYLLLQEKNDNTPTPVPPVVVPDAATLPCGSQIPVSVLANDTGEGITVTSATTAADGISVSVSGGTTVLVTSTTVMGIFTASYTIMDKASQTATANITVTVTDQAPPVIVCPAPVTLEGCGQPPAPAVSGQAAATDDCGPTPSVGFADELSGTTCDRLVTRTWSATDASGKNALCTQTIAIRDQTAPVFTLCPPAVTVPCGQQNNLDISGKAEAQDACNGATPLTHTDNTSGFDGCSGVIVRTFSSADSCGNTATCLQTITVFDNVQPVFTVCPQAVFANCGQQNNLDITGQAVAADACSGPATAIHTDDLSEFSACEGFIWRTFLATDLCGNTATCLQAITVVHVPCGFTPLFALNPAVCGDCNGAVSTTMSPPGSYIFEWETGDAGPNVTGLCPGPVSVTITDNVSECSNIFSPEVPDMPMLLLTVLQTIPPSGPSANDGRVVLQVGSPSAQLPFLVFVNGAPVGTANTYTFQITNMPAGEYEIFVVDEGGEGCPSNTVFVVLLPQEPPPAGPDAGFVSSWFEPGLPALPEHPGGVPTAAHVVWAPPTGFSAGVSLSRWWQFRLEATRQAGWLSRGGTGLSAVEPLQADRLMLGLRRYFPAGRQVVFFQENSMMHTALRVNLPTQSSASGLWQIGLGGGLRFSLENTLRIDVSGNLVIDLTPERLRFSSVLHVRLSTNLLQRANKPYHTQSLKL